MRLAILHLSDIHFVIGDNPVATRAETIAAATRSADPSTTNYLIAVTGDIAFSGDASEYQQASVFIGELVQELNKTGSCKVIMVPGNHDCDFSSRQEMRKVAVEQVAKSIYDLNLNGDFTTELLSAQKNYREFRAEFCSEQEAQTSNELCHTVSFEFGELRVQVNCYNTAFISQKKESQGSLYFPVHLAQAAVKHIGDRVISISIFHHPLNWIQASNAVLFLQHLETVSDLILTGHQHHISSYKKSNLTGEHVHYLEGAALQDRDSAESGFNVLVCDLADSREKTIHYLWNETQGMYVAENVASWRPITKNDTVLHHFMNTPDYIRYLQDVGTGFTHPRKRELQLKDIFIYPDLRCVSIWKRTNQQTRIASKDLLKYVVEHDKVVIFGSTQAGKTALAKTLYNDLQGVKTPRLIPLLLHGDSISTATESAVERMIQMHFGEQYGADGFERFRQLPKERRVLLIDDWHKAKINRNVRARNGLLVLLEALFGKIILLSDDLQSIQGLSSQSDSDSPLLKFESCFIAQMGWQLRGELLEKWELLGQEFTADDDEVLQATSAKERLIGALLNRNVLPSYPVIILTVLQTYEATKTSTAPIGTYGVLYQSLITKALAAVCKDSADLDTKSTVISRIAFRLFETEQTWISREDVGQITEEYFRLYSIAIDPAQLVRALKDAEILCEMDGNLRFRYKYYYWYFTAKYFHDNLRSDEQAKLNAVLKDMADRIYFEDYSSILMFVVAFTRDVSLINHLVENANRIYANQEVCDMETHVAFANRLYKERPRLVLPHTSIRDNRNRARQEIDEIEDAEINAEQNEKIQYDEGLSDIIKTNIAFKTLGLLGQILKNFPGSLLGDLKVEIAEAAYLLGLRTLRAILGLAETNIEELRAYIAQIIQEHRSFAQSHELAVATDEALVRLTRACAYAIVKRLSFAVGIDTLEETYRQVLKKHSNLTSVRLIDISVKLDHRAASFPESDIRELHKDLEHNTFAHTLLADLVATFFYLNPLEDIVTRQRIGKLLGIETTSSEMLQNQSKLLKASSGG